MVVGIQQLEIFYVQTKKHPPFADGCFSFFLQSYLSQLCTNHEGLIFVQIIPRCGSWELPW